MLKKNFWRTHSPPPNELFLFFFIKHECLRLLRNYKKGPIHWYKSWSAIDWEFWWINLCRAWCRMMVPCDRSFGLGSYLVLSYIPTMIEEKHCFQLRFIDNYGKDNQIRWRWHLILISRNPARTAYMYLLRNPSGFATICRKNAQKIHVSPHTETRGFLVRITTDNGGVPQR